jgi:hypothetical protein
MPARDRIVSLQKMGDGAFILLKTGRFEPETTKQAEIRLANLQKILRIAGFEAVQPLAKTGNGVQW